MRTVLVASVAVLLFSGEARAAIRIPTAEESDRVLKICALGIKRGAEGSLSVALGNWRKKLGNASAAINVEGALTELGGLLATMPEGKDPRVVALTRVAT